MTRCQSENFLLDCGSYRSALASVAKIVARPPVELEHEILTFDADHASEATGFSQPPIDCLRDHVVVDNCSLPEYRTCYFHVSRAPADTTFELGLLPTRMVRAHLSTLLREFAIDSSICTPSQWIEFQNQASTNRNNAGKPRRSPDYGHDAGPHGFLVREGLTADEHPSSYYFDLPEYV